MTDEETAWINAESVQKILRNALEDESITVTDVVLKAATSLGDNYMSDMHRVRVTFSKIHDGREVLEEKSLIYKVAPQHGVRESVVAQGGLFETELSMMMETLPKMNKILEPLGTTLAARSFYAHYEKPMFIVIEDLATRGFRMADRQEGLDLEHSLIAIRQLAKFHASSVRLKEEEPELVRSYNRGLFTPNQSEQMESYFTKTILDTAQEMATWPELDPRIPEKILTVSDVMLKRAGESIVVNEDGFNVLNHGDFWVNNMMFRYDDDGNILEHIFVDFQLCMYASPAADLRYFFGTSPSTDVRETHRELLMREYHVALTNTMTSLECTTMAPSLEELREDLRKAVWIEAVSILVILPTLIMDENAMKDCNSLDDISAATINLSTVRSKKYRRLISKCLPELDNE